MRPDDLEHLLLIEAPTALSTTYPTSTTCASLTGAAGSAPARERARQYCSLVPFAMAESISKDGISTDKLDRSQRVLYATTAEERPTLSQNLVAELTPCATRFCNANIVPQDSAGQPSVLADRGHYVHNTPNISAAKKIADRATSENIK